MMVLVVVSVFGTELYIHLISVPLLLVLLELNAVGFIDLKYGQGGQAHGTKTIPCPISASTATSSIPRATRTTLPLLAPADNLADKPGL